MKSYEPNPQQVARTLNDFMYHKVDTEQGNRLGAVRANCHELADFLLHYCPPSRELSLALTNLEQVMFWANAAIARNEKPTESNNESK